MVCCSVIQIVALKAKDKEINEKASAAATSLAEFKEAAKQERALLSDRVKFLEERCYLARPQDKWCVLVVESLDVACAG